MRLFESYRKKSSRKVFSSKREDLSHKNRPKIIASTEHMCTKLFHRYKKITMTLVRCCGFWVFSVS